MQQIAPRKVFCLLKQYIAAKVLFIALEIK